MGASTFKFLYLQDIFMGDQEKKPASSFQLRFPQTASSPRSPPCLPSPRCSMMPLKGHTALFRGATKEPADHLYLLSYKLWSRILFKEYLSAKVAEKLTFESYFCNHQLNNDRLEINVNYQKPKSAGCNPSVKGFLSSSLGKDL